MFEPPKEGSFIIVATLIAKGKAEADQLLELLAPIAKRATSSDEPGTKTYRVSREHSDKIKIVVFEEYENAAAFAAHHGTADFGKLQTAAPELCESFDIMFLDEIKA